LVLGALSAGCASYEGSARAVAPATLRAESGWQRIEDVPAVPQKGAKDCGAAALSSVLGYWRRPGPPPPREQIDAALRAGADADSKQASKDTSKQTLAKQGLRAGALRDYARRQGYRAYVFHGTFDDLQHELAAGRPVIVGVLKELSSREYLAHYQVVIGYHPAKERVLTLDPADGLREYPKTGFLEEWERAAHTTLVVMPEHPPDAHALTLTRWLTQDADSQPSATRADLFQLTLQVGGASGLGQVKVEAGAQSLLAITALAEAAQRHQPYALRAQ
jgi:predicted double-glycine peptidase